MTQRPQDVRTLTDSQWASATVAERALHVARSKVGTRENLGKNRGTWVNRFLAAVGLAPGYNWCAAFVRWCLDAAGADTAVLPNRRNSAGVWAWRNWARETGRLRTTPKRGDLMFWMNPNGTGHIGFVAQVFGSGNFWSRIRTLEGNTNAAGSRDGDGVYEKFRTRASLAARHQYGFIDISDLQDVGK